MLSSRLGFAVKFRSRSNTLFAVTCGQIYVVASKCSRNHLISDKDKTVQLFKLQFLQNSPFVQRNPSASNTKGVGNMSGSHFVNTFSSVPSHS